MKADGKSIIGLVGLAAGKDSRITIEAVGDDAEQALDALEDLVVRRKFDEE
jgi:phosphotransferase system HPr (HPr) family protein